MTAVTVHGHQHSDTLSLCALEVDGRTVWGAEGLGLGLSPHPAASPGPSPRAGSALWSLRP